MMFDLPFIWAGLIAFAVLAYVRARRLRSRHRHPLSASSSASASRDQAMNSVAPVWDGNETWLVLGGGGLMAAFPLAYAVIAAGALRADHRHAARRSIFRGVAFEFRWRDPARQVPVGLGLRRRLDAGDLRPGRGARRARPGHPASRTAPMPAAGGTG